MSLGSDALISSIAFKASFVTVSVLEPGCFSILRITAGLPLNEPSPLLIGPPNFTSATCFSKMGAAFRLLTTVLAKSSNVFARPIFLISVSEPLLSTKPPVVF